MTKIFNSDHSRRAMFCTLLSLLMWVVGIGGASAGNVVPRNPIVKIISGPTYSDNGTEVTLKLWMYNYDATTPTLSEMSISILMGVMWLS